MVFLTFSKRNHRVPISCTKWTQFTPSKDIPLTQVLKLPSLQSLGFPSYLFPSAVPIRTLWAFLFSPLLATRPSPSFASLQSTELGRNIRGISGMLACPKAKRVLCDPGVSAGTISLDTTWQSCRTVPYDKFSLFCNWWAFSWHALTPPCFQTDSNAHSAIASCLFPLICQWKRLLFQANTIAT